MIAFPKIVCFVWICEMEFYKMGLKKTALPGWVVSFCYCSQVGTFETESAVRKRGGSRNLPYLNAKPRKIPLLGTYA